MVDFESQTEEQGYHTHCQTVDVAVAGASVQTDANTIESFAQTVTPLDCQQVVTTGTALTEAIAMEPRMSNTSSVDPSVTPPEWTGGEDCEPSSSGIAPQILPLEASKTIDFCKSMCSDDEPAVVECADSDSQGPASSSSGAAIPHSANAITSRQVALTNAQREWYEKQCEAPGIHTATASEMLY